MHKEHKPWYLKQMQVFDGISEKEIMAIALQLVEKKCMRKEVLYSPYDVSDNVFILKEGEVTLYHLHNGKKIVLDVLLPGDIWGAIDFEQSNRTHFAEVSKDAYLCILPLHEFLEILKKHPELMLRFLQQMSSRISYYEARVKDTLLDAREKVRAFLDRYHNQQKHWWQVFTPRKELTHENIAEHTGLSRETVSRVIADLKKESLRA